MPRGAHLGIALGMGAVLSLSGTIVALVWAADVAELTAGQWSGGGGVGFLGSTPDGIAEFAMNGHADYFMTPRFSVGTVGSVCRDRK